MKITEQTTLGEIYNLPGLRASRDYLIGNGAALFQTKGEITLQQLNEKQPTWYVKDMIYGLNRLIEIAEKKKPYFFTVYSEEEMKEDANKQDVKLFHFPGTENGRFAILLSGGAYGCVCSMAESFPVAAKFNEMGITVFCLNYRVYIPEMGALLPKPIDDLAAAYRFIAGRAEEFQIDPNHYLVGGFSAGGHVSAEWGTQNMGARKYQLPQPEQLLLGYSFITTEKMRETISKEFWEYFFTAMFGTGYTKVDEARYSVNQHVDREYPPTYLVQSMDDGEVPYYNLICMKEALETAGVRYKSENPETGGHGFGLGSATEAAGWVERAVEFWNQRK